MTSSERAWLDQKRLKERFLFFFMGAFSRIIISISSHSLPASVAMITSSRSALFRSLKIVLNWPFVFAMGEYWKGSGKMGRFSTDHLFRAGSYSAGLKGAQRCPKAQVLIWPGPS